MHSPNLGLEREPAKIGSVVGYGEVDSRHDKKGPIGPMKSNRSLIVTSLVYEFKNGGWSRIAAPIAGLDQSSVAAVAILEARAYVVEEVLNQVFAVEQALSGKDLLLFEIGLPGQFLDWLGAAAAVADEHFACLAPCNERVLSRKRDQLLDEALKFLRPTKGRANVPVADELSLQVRQECPALVARQSKFSAVYKVSHFSSF